MHMPYDLNERVSASGENERVRDGAPREAAITSFDAAPPREARQAAERSERGACDEGPPGSSGDIRCELNLEGTPTYETPFTPPT